MSRFFIKLFWFSLLPILLTLGFDVYLRTMETQLSAKYRGLMDIKNDVDLIVLGNSHANYAVNPKYINSFNAYNLANVSQKIYFDSRILYRALNDGVDNLKIVLISIDYHSLFTSSQGHRDVWTYYKNGIRYKDKNYFKENLSPFIWGYTPKVAISILKKDLIRRTTYQEPMINFEVEKDIDPRDGLFRGFIGFSGQTDRPFNKETFVKKVEQFVEPINSERDEVIQELKKFILTLQENGIHPILFSSPTYHKYNQYLNPETIHKNKMDISNLTQEFNIEYWRFNEDPRFKIIDFYNQDHLNKKGAKKFSKILNEKLLKFSKTLKYKE